MGKYCKNDVAVLSDLALECISIIAIANPSINHIGKKYITELALIAAGTNIIIQSENDLPRYLNSSLFD